MRKTDFEIFVNFRSRQILDPFDQAHAVGVEILAQIQCVDLILLTDPVKIDMVNRQSALIFIDQRERRAADPRFLPTSIPAQKPRTKSVLPVPNSPPKPTISPPATSFARFLPQTHGVAGGDRKRQSRNPSPNGPPNTTSIFLWRYRDYSGRQGQARALSKLDLPIPPTSRAGNLRRREGAHAFRQTIDDIRRDQTDSPSPLPRDRRQSRADKRRAS